MQGKPDFSSMKVKLSNRLGTRDEQGSSSRILHTCRMENRRYEAGAGEAEQCKGNGRFFLVSFLLATQDHGVCWLNQCQPNKCYE